jgi:hypothetical protein
MALMYPWATKEYLLWQMTIGQLVMYHNLGIELKYGGATKRTGPRSLRNASPAQVARARREARRQLGIPEGSDVKAKLREKYGAV